MISDALREEIQNNYRNYLKSTGFKPRSGQKHMIANIAKNLCHSQTKSRISVVEAGTGTGKTLGYLLPTLPIARDQGKTLVISTATVALQEQLINKDIPEIREHCGMDFSYVLVKGRGRYLCNAKLESILGTDGGEQDLPFFADLPSLGDKNTIPLYRELREKSVSGAWDGDRDHWPESIRESDWRPLVSDRYQCAGRNCPHVSQCAFFQARDELLNADCLITNHDLVLSDLALGGGVILPPPEDCLYVFDEAHHLADKARGHFSARCRLGQARGFLDQIPDLLTRLTDDLADSLDLVRAAQEVMPDVERSSRLMLDAQKVVELVFPDAESLVERSFGARNRDDMPLEWRLPEGLIPSDLMQAAQALATALESTQTRVERLSTVLDRQLDHAEGKANSQKVRDWMPLVGQWLLRIQGYAALWRDYALVNVEQQRESARWIKYFDQNSDYELNCAPIVAAERLNQLLWNNSGGVVLTSATLTALGSFDRFKLHTGVPEDAEFSQFSSPFFYADAATLYTDSQGADPKDTDAHDRYIADWLPKLTQHHQGALVLFASDRQMRNVYDLVSASYARNVLVQGDMSKQAIIDRHRTRVDAGKNNVIFGLASFAEGIDLPGRYCSLVVISKIPFAVPSDPVEAALTEWVQSRGGNPFRDITLADASLRLIQATGRLLRSESDRGDVVILDKRVVNSGYGKTLVQSLPEFNKSDLNQYVENRT